MLLSKLSELEGERHAQAAVVEAFEPQTTSQELRSLQICQRADLLKTKILRTPLPELRTAGGV